MYRSLFQGRGVRQHAPLASITNAIAQTTSFKESHERHVHGADRNGNMVYRAVKSTQGLVMSYSRIPSVGEILCKWHGGNIPIQPHHSAQGHMVAT
jgi:hypothetical protein